MIYLKLMKYFLFSFIIKSLNTLTHNKKYIRDLLMPDKEYSFISAGADDIKTWSCPEGKYIRIIKENEGIINSISLNQDGVFVSGGEDVKLFFRIVT
jgi:pleiotropic regulator 1